MGHVAVGGQGQAPRDPDEPGQTEGAAVLKATDRVAVAIGLYLAEVKAKVKDGRRAPGSLETYEYQAMKNLIPGREDCS